MNVTQQCQVPQNIHQLILDQNTVEAKAEHNADEKKRWPGFQALGISIARFEKVKQKTATLLSEEQNFIKCVRTENQNSPLECLTK